MIPTRIVRINDTRIRQKLGVDHVLWTTLEGENPGGSIKDRMVRPELLQIKASLLALGASLIECPPNTAYEQYEEFCLTSDAWRYLTQLNFGSYDPCDLQLIDHRLEMAPHDYFEDRSFNSDAGPTLMSDSFRLTLGAAISFLAGIRAPSIVFLIGSHCKFLK